MANPDVQIKEGPGHPDPEISGGLFSKKIFKALRASVWSNNKEGRNAESRISRFGTRNLEISILACRILKFQEINE